MSLRGGARGGGWRPHRRGGWQGAVVDLTPLIDITFQLLIFFLLTATFQQANPSFKVKLPKANNQDVAQEPKAIVVSISSDGAYQVDGKEVDARELELRLCAANQDERVAGVNVRADEATEHKYVVKVIEIAKQCGLEKLGILHGR